MQKVEVHKTNWFQRVAINTAAAIDQILQNNVSVQKIKTDKGTQIKIIEEQHGAIIILVDNIMILC